MSEEENQQVANVEYPMTKKRKFVADGVFYAELNEFLTRELGPDGYSGVEVRKTPVTVSIIIRATKTQNILGVQGRRIRELTSLIHQRFFPRHQASYVKLYAERVLNRALCAVANAENLRMKLLGGMQVRRAAYGIIRYIMENEAKGCEIVVAGKVRGQRAKAQKFNQGYMLKSGNAAKFYCDRAVRHIQLKQGMIGVSVAIMLPYDPTGKNGGCKVRMSDVIKIHDPPTAKQVTKKFEPEPVETQDAVPQGPQ
jgi:small subunit ribosomal protein S3e